MLSFSQLQISPPNRWQDFEDLCHSLWSAEWDDPHAQKHGRPGQRQHGVDVFGLPKGKDGYAGVQCKCVDVVALRELTPTQIKQEVTKARSFKPSLQSLIIATTLPRDAKLQEVARQITARHRSKQLFSVHVFGWDDIADMLSRHPTVATHHYPHLASYFTQSASVTRPAKRRDKRNIRDESMSGPHVILPSHSQRALGIIAVSPFPTKQSWLELLFPKIPWGTEIKNLCKAGVLLLSDGVLFIPPPVSKVLLSAPDDERRFFTEWIEVLHPLRGHVDTALMLGLQYIRIKEYKKATVTITDIAQGLEAGRWNETYQKVLLASYVPKIMRTLSRQERLEFYNAVGLCLAQSNSPADAIPWFKRLRKDSRRWNNVWGLGQSFINEGVAHLNIGDADAAAIRLNEAVAHGKKHRDYVLVGRATHDLANLYSATDPDKATRFLDASIKAKTVAKDSPHGPSPLICRGLIEASRGNHGDALQTFTHAERAAELSQQFDARAIALCNMGRANLDLGHPRKAIAVYAKARKICEDEGFQSTLILILKGEAATRHAMKDFASAESIYLRLRQSLLPMNAFEDAAIALHDAAIMAFRGKRPSSAALFRRALAFSRRHRIDEWTYRCLKDQALVHIERKQTTTALRLLRRSGAQEVAKKHHRVAARLFEDVIQVLIQHRAAREDIESAFRDASAAWGRAPDGAAEVSRLFEGMYSWHWGAGRFDDALKTLDAMAHHAEKHRLRSQLCRTLDHHGIALQELNRFDDVESMHRRALKLARQLKDASMVEQSLNNLAELLRKIDRPREAIPLLHEAEALARKKGDHISEIAIAHNRSLALSDLGKKKAAVRLLRRCRDTAKKVGDFREYARSLHGLANSAWTVGQPAEAMRLYREAIRAARRAGAADQLSQICLNVGNVLKSIGKPKRALPYFQEALRSCPDPHDMFRCLVDLAECCQELKDYPAARATLLKARELAVTAMDHDAIALFSASLSSIYEQEHKFRKAEAELARALSHEKSPENRVHLLVQQLGLFLAAKKEKSASKVFEKIRRVVSESPAFKEVYIDIHMMIGDYNWRTEGPNVESMKAYLAALGEAWMSLHEELTYVGGHIYRKLMAIPRPKRLERIAQLETDITTWLQTSRGEKIKPETTLMLLWPLRVAKRMTDNPSSGNGAKDQDVAQVVLEEMGFSPSKRSVTATKQRQEGGLIAPAST